MKSENMEITTLKHKEALKIALVVILSIVACLILYYFRRILKTHVVSTHFFYIPIILSAYWWKKRGLVTGVFLAAVLLISNVVFENGHFFINDFLRVCAFLVIGIIASVLSERFGRVEKELREKNEFHQTTLNALPYPFYVIDAEDYTIKLSNLAYYIGKALPEKATCHQITRKSSVPCNSEAYPCPIQELKKTDSPQVMEHIHYDKNGNPINVEVYAYPVFDSKGKLSQIIKYSIDITERKKAAEVLKETQSQLFQTAKLATLGEMSAGLAHEMNQPLNGIALTAQSIRKLMDRGTLTNVETEDALKDINTSVIRMNNIIQHIRIFSRQDTLRFVEVDVNEPIENALSLLEEQLRLHGIEVIKEYTDDLPKITGEPYQLEQVVINALVNARDAVDEKGLTNPGDYSGKITCKTEKAKDGVRIAISDNGIGMSAEVKEKIFQPFFTTKEVGKATGLGMSICFGIIAAHNGRMEVESQKGEGTTIEVFFPIKTAIVK